MRKPIQWQYGVTTVPARAGELLNRTLRSLEAAGFPHPYLFVDNCEATNPHFLTIPYLVARRYPCIGVTGNFILALWELYARNPLSQRYAVFQDDIVCCRGLRKYLESFYAPNTYQNLCTYPQNQALADGFEGWFHSNQKGRGAQALVFDNNAVCKLLSQENLLERIKTGKYRQKTVDGSVVTALAKARVFEIVHNPSLVCHVGKESTLGNNTMVDCTSFPGEEFDLSTLPLPTIRSLT